MSHLKGISSPKRKPSSANSRAIWFPYYASYSSDFVHDLISRLDLRNTVTLLDPWLGSGTTSEVAVLKRLKVRGYDLNPAMLLVAKARTLPTNSLKRIIPLAEIISNFYLENIGKNMKFASRADEPLEQWFQPSTARYFRALERTIPTVVSEQKISLDYPIWNQLNKASPCLAFFYVGLFRTVRSFISGYQGSNPTWIKTLDKKKRIHASAEKILKKFIAEINTMLGSAHSEAQITPQVNNDSCLIERASSLLLPLPKNSIDVVISSPPYCTRIDYVRATLPELAVIDFPNGESIRHLREEMIGTPTITGAHGEPGVAWGRTCLRFLSAVKRHPSKASATYYMRYFLQYFASVYGSLREIDRVLKKSGKCVLVVQDSYYKEVLNDLPCIFSEMAVGLGWTILQQLDFRVKQTKSSVNHKARQYRSVFQANESVLLFSK